MIAFNSSRRLHSVLENSPSAQVVRKEKTLAPSPMLLPKPRNSKLRAPAAATTAKSFSSHHQSHQTLLKVKKLRVKKSHNSRVDVAKD